MLLKPTAKVIKNNVTANLAAHKNSGRKGFLG